MIFLVSHDAASFCNYKCNGFTQPTLKWFYTALYIVCSINIKLLGIRLNMSLLFVPEFIIH